MEFRSLKNQDITIRKLENKLLELERTGEEETQSRLEQARQELVESEGRRAAEALEREATAERRVAKLEIELRAERAGREATQTTLLEADEGAHAREADWEAQRQIFIDDSDRLRELLHEASRERDESATRSRRDREVDREGVSQRARGGDRQGWRGRRRTISISHLDMPSSQPQLVSGGLPGG